MRKAKGERTKRLKEVKYICREYMFDTKSDESKNKLAYYRHNAMALSHKGENEWLGNALMHLWDLFWCSRLYIIYKNRRVRNVK